MHYKKLSDDRCGESSDSVKARMETARELQRERFYREGDQEDNPVTPQVSSNSDMHPKEIRKFCKLDEASQSLMRFAMSQMQLYTQAYYRVLKSSRTIGDLAQEAEYST